MVKGQARQKTLQPGRGGLGKRAGGGLGATGRFACGENGSVGGNNGGGNSVFFFLLDDWIWT